MKKNNKGFSLVELIIVIAIMAVLVGVLAPQFIKYVEQSRRSRDIQTAQEIREAVLAAIADQRIDGSETSKSINDFTKGTTGSLDTLPAEDQKASGSIAKDQPFNVSYNAVTGTCSVSVTTTGGTATTYVLTNELEASAYKAATS